MTRQNFGFNYLVVPIQNLIINIKTISIIIAFLSGFCSLGYQICWTRVLKYFLDNSIYSFSIVLIVFLTGLSFGGFLFYKYLDSKKNEVIILSILQILICFLCFLSIPIICKADVIINFLNKIFGHGFFAEYFIRIIVFGLIFFIPTTLMGAVFPLIIKIYTQTSLLKTKAVGEVYAINTIGAVCGSFIASFVFIPFLGVQKSISLLAFVNLFLGCYCILYVKNYSYMLKVICITLVATLYVILLLILPKNVFLPVYSLRYPAHSYELLYFKENINGTTTVFKEKSKEGTKYLLIDGIGEVSTDYFSMRAFRMLGLLGAIYYPQIKNVAIVTFGSGIAAGTVASLPEIESLDCIEICKEAFNAAKIFSEENYNILSNPKANFIVEDARNFLFTTKKTYDMISADASHPTNNDSWILYTKEFYKICFSRLSSNGIMCQWIPLRGILEKDYKRILHTFNSVFPYMSLWYTGGYKGIGHTIICGSKSPLNIDVGYVNTLLTQYEIKNNLKKVNIHGLQDILNCFVMNQENISAYYKGAGLNTDNKCQILFSRKQSWENPFIGLSDLMKFREIAFPYLRNLDSIQIDSIKNQIQKNYIANTYSINGQIDEFEEYNNRLIYNKKKTKEEISKELQISKEKITKILDSYVKALEINPADDHTRYLMFQDYLEYRRIVNYLNNSK
jgi:spermidine synthase